MKLYVEEQIFKQNEYSEDSILSQSRFHQQQVSQGENVWISCQYRRSILDDASDIFQLGQSDVRTFHTFSSEFPQKSGWVDFPTEEEPGKLFKYASFDIDLSQDTNEWSR